MNLECLNRKSSALISTVPGTTGLCCRGEYITRVKPYTICANTHGILVSFLPYRVLDTE